MIRPQTMTPPQARTLALIACATATLLGAAPAHAQSSEASTVTIYGIMDLGVEYRTRNNAAGDSVLRVNSGGLNTSRLGFKGKEDLGNGLSAQFNLESEVVADTGSADTSAFFGRQAWVGLEQKGLGGISLGRMSTVAYDFTIGHDFMGFAPQYSWVTKTASVPAPGFTSRISNAVRYLGKFGAIKVGANVGLGEVADSVNANTSRGLSVGYDEGAVSAQLSLDDGRSAATDASHPSTSNRSWIASGTYSIDSTKLYAGVRDTQRQPVGTVSSTTKYHSTLIWLGASAPLTSAITAYGGIYLDKLHGTRSDPMMLTGKLHYNLSKRTWLYATAAVARAQSDDGVTTLTGVYRDQTPVASHQTGLGLGIQHRF
jgi:predicted porin